MEVKIQVQLKKVLKNKIQFLERKAEAPLDTEIVRLWDPALDIVPLNMTVEEKELLVLARIRSFVLTHWHRMDPLIKSTYIPTLPGLGLRLNGEVVEEIPK